MSVVSLVLFTTPQTEAYTDLSWTADVFHANSVFSELILLESWKHAVLLGAASMRTACEDALFTVGVD